MEKVPVARTVVMTGGGIKGAVMAARYAPQGELILWHGDYGQRAASAERAAVEGLARTFPKAKVVAATLPQVEELSGLLQATPGAESRRGRTADSEAGGITPTALSGLLPVLVSSAAQCALQVGAKQLGIGLSRLCNADHLGLTGLEGRPGWLEEFRYGLNLMLETLSGPRAALLVETPLGNLSYAEIMALAHHFQLPLEEAWSCSRAVRRPCGKCATCRARTAALAVVGVSDTLAIGMS
ncbi:MAG: 7-cyano-7-deazaguanine synthase [Planctomycetes bacterium]|nr:7-cyano-7-deazaguanine synthase [Planctomycetota bacterium]